MGVIYMLLFFPNNCCFALFDFVGNIYTVFTYSIFFSTLLYFLAKDVVCKDSLLCTCHHFLPTAQADCLLSHLLPNTSETQPQKLCLTCGFLWFLHTGLAEPPYPFHENLIEEDPHLAMEDHRCLGYGASETNSENPTEVPPQLIAVPLFWSKVLHWHCSSLLNRAPTQTWNMWHVWLKQNSLPLFLIYSKGYYSCIRTCITWLTYICLR